MLQAAYLMCNSWGGTKQAVNGGLIIFLTPPPLSHKKQLFCLHFFTYCHKKELPPSYVTSLLPYLLCDGHHGVVTN